MLKRKKKCFRTINSYNKLVFINSDISFWFSIRKMCNKHEIIHWYCLRFRSLTYIRVYSNYTRMHVYVIDPYRLEWNWRKLSLFWFRNVFATILNVQRSFKKKGFYLVKAEEKIKTKQQQNKQWNSYKNGLMYKRTTFGMAPKLAHSRIATFWYYTCYCAFHFHLFLNVYYVPNSNEFADNIIREHYC